MAETAVQGFRLSPQQRRLWALAREEGSAYRAEAAVRITGPLDRARLEAALGEVVARHEILRTVFPVPPGMSRPAQVIQPPEPVRLADAPGPFRPDREPPFAASLVSEGPESHRLHLAAHAFVADAAALEVVVRDLARAYAGRLDGEPPAQYADVAEALNELLESDETEAGRDFWREEGALPAERDSAPFSPQWVSLGLETSASAATLLAAWRTLLWRLGLDGAAIGVEYPGRHYEGFDTAAGPFARFLPVRLPVADGLSFAELADQAAGKLAELEDWQDYFFPEGGFLSAGFRFAEPADPEPAGPVRFEVERARGWTERFELLLSARGLVLELGYDAARFGEEEAHRILEAFRALLENAEPASRLGDLELIRPEERRRLLEELAGPAVPIPPVPVHRLILERTSDAIALSGEDGIRVTYGELAERTRQLATYLRSLGVGAETRVGLCADRSPEMIVGLLAILEAGGAWVPLDPSYPAARLAFMLGDSKAPVVLVQDHLRDRLEASGVEVVLLPPRVSTLGYPNTAPGGGTDESAAYVLYTSGSTGTPKGVVVRHRALTNQIRWMLDAYPLEQGDRVLQKTPSSFDASVWEILAPLAAGAELVLASPGAHRDPVAMGRVLREREVMSLQVVPALLRLLLDGGHLEGCPSLARLFCGGEPLTEDLRERVHRLSDRIELINLYGPTETTVQVTSWVAERRASDRAVPVGRPVLNARLYLLDPWGRLAPAGLPGEVWIGGVAPARGYLDRPDLTGDSFRPDPFSGEPGARMYRSGDLGRLRADGALEFLGRIGGQNKVRGYRFDPGEIEAILRAHPSVQDAVVLVREDRLVAYAVPGEGTPSLALLRPFLAERLPDYLVPTDLVVLPALPLSPSGKVDRSALPAPGEDEASAPGGSVAPRTPLEEILAEIWAGLLGRERVGVHDDFFELGGHSLLGAQLVARVRDALGVEVSLRNVFEAPTVAGLAARVEEEWRGDAPPVPPLVPVPREPGAALPLSFAQQRLWFLDRLSPGSAYYNVPSAVRFTGELDERALAAAFNEIVRLHEALRTTFHNVEGRPAQTAAPSLVLPLPVVDLSGLADALREDEAHRLALEEAQRPFDLATGPLARLILLRLGEGERVLLTTLHHIVSDAWSVGVLYRSLLALYTAFAAGKPSPLAPPPVQYADYAVWQRERFAGEAWERELAWWARQLADLPVLRLPADRPRPPRQTFRGAGVTAELPGDLAARLRALARERGATLFMVLLAGFQALLHRITGQDEVVLGSPVANRERSEVEGLIGFFVNTLVLRTDVSGNPSFADLVSRARETALGAWAHQSLPFERLVEELQPERDLSRQPLFQVMFQLQNVPLPDFGLPGVAVEPLEVEPGTAPFDLGVDLLEIPGGLLLSARYATDLFDHTTVLRLVDRYSRLLEAVAAEPDRRVGEIPLLSEPERRQLPLASHGKVDEKALPAPRRVRPDLGKEPVPPRTPAEEILAGVWAAVLGTDRVGVTDDFFALGGHSLLATQVVSRIRQAFGVEVELRALFESPTVAGLAARIETAAGPAAPPLVPRAWEGPERPLSFAQRRLWFLDRLEPGRATYNMPSALRIRGRLSLPALAAAFDDIARRHEVLRERIVPSGDGPVALVDPPAPRPFPLADLSALPAAPREAEARRLALEEALRPFDLEKGPLFRTAVLRLREREHAVLWTIHHIVSDGWSEGVLAAEVAALYAGNPLPPLPARYADFALWQGERLQGGELEARLAWWRERLAGAPTRLDLPTDRPRPAVASGKGRRLAFQLPVAEAVRGLCRREGVTPFMALFAAFAALLGRLARQEDLLMGTPVAGRRHAEVEGLIGFFIDTLALRANLSGDPTGGELLARVRETALGAWAHQDLPFERLVEELAPERDLGRQPLVQAVLQLQNIPAPAVHLQGLVVEPLGVDSGVAPFDLGLDLVETRDGIAGSVRYATDLFDETTVRRVVDAYERLLTGLAGDPGRRIAEIPLVSEADWHQLLTEWNDTAVEIDAAPVHRLVAARAAERPEAVAIVFEGEALAYGDLVRRAGQLAERLRE
ncbi:MAG TPA: amino acid adenylation domain-containing protein, partial [Thermoanaerobaculia bacterium]|nr:amino acid adenylation domain-containing protein [Thermoanaerobaculia bacterium]